MHRRVAQYDQPWTATFSSSLPSTVSIFVIFRKLHDYSGPTAVNIPRSRCNIVVAQPSVWNRQASSRFMRHCNRRQATATGPYAMERVPALLSVRCTLFRRHTRRLTPPTGKANLAAFLSYSRFQIGKKGQEDAFLSLDWYCCYRS